MRVALESAARPPVGRPRRAGQALKRQDLCNLVPKIFGLNLRLASPLLDPPVGLHNFGVKLKFHPLGSFFVSMFDFFVDFNAQHLERPECPTALPFR